MTSRTGPLAGRCILVAEDEYLIARDLERTLLGAGCAEVWLVPSIADSDQIRARTDLDAAVLDLRLRDGEASGLARALRADRVPILFITGYEETAIPDDLSELPLLAKPFPRQQLLASLTALLAAANNHDGNGE